MNLMKLIFSLLVSGALLLTGILFGEMQEEQQFGATPVSTVPQGGTGTSTVGIGNVLFGQGSGLPGSLQFGGISAIHISTTTNSLGISTSSPKAQIDIFSTGSSSLRLDSNANTKGGCIVLKDSDGVGYTYVSGNNGVLSASTGSCQ